MIEGDHLLETPKGRQYQVTLHDPVAGAGHCSCPDFQSNRLREMMGEAPHSPVSEGTPARELPEDTPHFLNPGVLGEESVDPAGEKAAAATVEKRRRPSAPAPVAQSPEKMEEVLNQGMSFISGLMEMATGQKIEAVGGAQAKLVTLDRETGEVALKFRLPGFGV